MRRGVPSYGGTPPSEEKTKKAGSTIDEVPRRQGPTSKSECTPWAPFAHPPPERTE